MHHSVRRTRHDVLLRQHLQAVGHELQTSKPSDAVGAQPVLDSSQPFALENGGDTKEQGKQNQDRRDR
jgi:hypothetical protein